MQVHVLFVMRKLIAWLFALLSTLLPHHLLAQLPENERCLAPHEASMVEMQPTSPIPATDAATPVPRPKR
jgi:hypothetical protein